MITMITNFLIVLVIYNFKKIQCKAWNLNIKLLIIVQNVYQKNSKQIQN